MSPKQKKNAEPYVKRLEKLKEQKPKEKGVPKDPNDDSVYKILKDFINNHVGRRQYSVKIEGQTYSVVLKKNIAGKIASGIRGKNTDEVVEIGKLLLVCLSNIDDVLENGRKTKFIDNATDSGQHKGSRWLYVNDYVVEPGLVGEVAVEIEFPEIREKDQSNVVYHITTSGSVGYERMKNARITPKLALEGEVKIRRV